MGNIEYILILWILISASIIALIIYREPNVESAGAIIQESLYRDEQPDRFVDIVLMVLVVLFIVLTIDMFL
jgi:protein translocase SecG subunit